MPANTAGGAPRGVSVILPAYNSVANIRSTVVGVRDVLESSDTPFQIIVVDDGSPDELAPALSGLGVEVLRNPYRKGPGAAVKAAVGRARGDVVVMMSAEGEHDPHDIPHLVGPIGDYDLVVGARSPDALGGFPRRLASHAYNGLASYLSGQKIHDLTSSFRAFKGDVLRKLVYLFPDEFSYTATSTIAVIKGGYRMTHVPVKARESTHKVGPGIFITILKVVTSFHPLRVFGTASLAAILLGLISTLLTFYIERRFHIPNSAVLLYFMGFLVFLMGLLAEQIAAFRLEYGERFETQGSWEEPVDRSSE